MRMKTLEMPPLLVEMAPFLVKMPSLYEEMASFQLLSPAVESFFTSSLSVVRGTIILKISLRPMTLMVMVSSMRPTIRRLRSS